MTEPTHDLRQIVRKGCKNRQIRDLLFQVLDHGEARVEQSKDRSEGVVIYGKEGTRPFHVHLTIGEHRAALNVRSRLRQIGALPS